MRTIILDNGHGYDTLGKSAMMPTGEIFEEWEFTRIIKLRVISKMHRLGIPFVDLVPFSHDVSLKDRIKLENLKAKKHGKTFLCSIHADAFTDEKANGITVFTSRSQNRSDEYGDVLVDQLRPLGLSNRYDIDSEGLKGREADFYIIKNSKSYSALVELGFMTNNRDVKQLFDSKFQERIADCLVNAFIKFQKM